MRMILPGVLFVMLLPACKVSDRVNQVKALTVLKKGSPPKQEFITEVPFQLVNNLVIIKVSIRGKWYSFVLDTGAPPTVLSEELANELGLKTLAKYKVEDVNGKQVLQKWAQLDTISIGGIPFFDVPCISSNISAQQVFACMKFDGIIGASLMRHAAWSFDFKRSMVTIAGNVSQLTVPAGSALSFETGSGYAPQIEIAVNNKKTDQIVMLDMGYSGTLLLGKQYFRRMDKTMAPVFTTYSVGNSATGLYGNGDTDTIYYREGDINLAGTTMRQQVIDYRKTGPTIIGMQVLKNYNFTIDWPRHTVYFNNIKEAEADSIKPFGFSYSFMNDTLIVNQLFAGSDAWRKGLQNGDIILSINNRSLLNLSKEQQCDILLHGAYSLQVEKLNLEILRNGVKKLIEIEKTNYRTS